MSCTCPPPLCLHVRTQGRQRCEKWDSENCSSPNNKFLLVCSVFPGRDIRWVIQHPLLIFELYRVVVYTKSNKQSSWFTQERSIGASHCLTLYLAKAGVMRSRATSANYPLALLKDSVGFPVLRMGPQWSREVNWTFQPRCNEARQRKYSWFFSIQAPECKGAQQFLMLLSATSVQLQCT